MTGELTRRIETRKTGAGFAALVEQVVARYCGKRWHKGKRKVALVIDNFRIHSCRRAAEVLARYRDRIEIISLPTYAPELNVIERVWKHLRRRVTHTHLFTSVEKMVAAVNEFFMHLDEHPREVLSVIGSTG